MESEASQPEIPEVPEIQIVDLTAEATEVTREVTPVEGVSDTEGRGRRGRRGKSQQAKSAPPQEDVPRTAKSGPPTADEWQQFIGGTVLRILTEGYLHLVLFREIDESELTERERNLIRLEREDLHDMAAPMASFANKSKLARKHGRTIIAAGDSYESVIDLFIWMRRVNRIARKYRKQKPTVIQGETLDGQVPTTDVGPDGRGNQAPPITGVYNPGTG